MAPPTARFQFAFEDDTLTYNPTWHDMDDSVHVASYTIDRGRSFELDRMDTGRATITLHDTEGIFDATTGLFIEPLKGVRLALWNPVLEDWYTRFRGFVEAYEIDFDPTQQVNHVTIRCIDIMEIIAAVQMFPGNFGYETAPDPNVVFFEDTADGDEHGMQSRILAVLTGDAGPPATLGDVGLSSDWYDIFSGNVSLHEASYSPAESALVPIMDALEAEFPGGLATAYGDRLGRFVAHGRFAKFDPEGTAAATGDWDFHDWDAGDGTAVALDPTGTAQIRSFSISRDLAKVINVAMASPVTDEEAPDFEGQYVEDSASKATYGIRGWAAQNLLTKEGVTDGFLGDGADWEETKRFAQYYVDNYKDPQNRVTQITFRSMEPSWIGAAPTWALMSEVDIGDRVSLEIDSPGGAGGGFHLDPSDPLYNKFFVEGIHEEYRPLRADETSGDFIDDVTISLDLSPAKYFQDNPFST